MANIIELFQPLEPYEIEALYKEIKSFSSYHIQNTAGHKIRNIKIVLFLMEKMKLIYKKDGYYMINSRISCYNTLFRISRKEFNDFRIEYLNRIAKLQPQRIDVL